MVTQRYKIKKESTKNEKISNYHKIKHDTQEDTCRQYTHKKLHKYTHTHVHTIHVLTKQKLNLQQQQQQ